MSIASDTSAPRAAARPLHLAALRQLLLNRRLPQDDEPRVYLVRGAPSWNGPATLPGPDGHDVRIATAVSPLEVWELIVRHAETRDESLLAIITDAEEHDLGPNVLAHVFRYRVLITDLWEAVRQASGATGLDPRLADEGWAAEALLDSGVGRDQKLVGTILSKDTALAHLAARRLSTAAYPLDPAGLDFRVLLNWTCAPDGVSRLDALRPAERRGLTRWLAERTGQAGKVLLALCESGSGEQSVPIGLLYSALWLPHAPASSDRAKGRAEQFFRDGTPSDGELSTYGQAVAEYVRTRLARVVGELDPATRYLLDRAESLVRQFGAEDAAALSTLLPSGLDARFTAVASALETCLSTIGSTRAEHELAFSALRHALDDLSSHALARFDTTPQRVETVRMAVRLTSWLACDPRPDFATAPQALDRFAADHAWVDHALGYVFDGDDTDAQLQAVFRKLYGAVRDRRRAIDREFATRLAEYTADGSMSGEELTVESFARRVLAPVVKSAKADQPESATPLLFLLLDGMSGAVATGLARHLRRQWIEYDPVPVPTGQASGSHPRRHAMFAALPTLTSVSRGSLFSGSLADIRQDEERRRFEKHDFWNRAAVRLFHKADLRGLAGSVLGDELTDALSRPEVHVAVVVNTIDDRLKEERPVSAWTISELLGVESLLTMARDTGRAVVIASDHGHMLDRGARKTGASDPLSARHRTIDGTVADGEVLLAGTRVVTGSGEITALWDTELRYTDQKAGYHGGASLAEVAIPVLAFLPHGANVPKGWRELGPQEPAWWMDAESGTRLSDLYQTDEDAGEGSPLQQLAPVSRRPRGRSKQVEGQQAMDLFLEQPVDSRAGRTDPVSESSADRTAKVVGSTSGSRPSRHSALLAALRDSELFDAQLGALPRPESADAIEAALLALLESGGVAPLSFVAQRANKPAARAAGFAVTLQRLFNYDQVEVLEIIDGNRMLRLNTELLRRQFDLPGAG
ncbi:BREX-2 system phosphatase PglZ [Actinospica robiniae]|uniref:BREX-2 system phosphatase PglZ n=1 Tax=Actinospica robiniae TaxID=304901 RepID=UPI0004085577|nr:BREX-2 system phosphatase PglZ [Actinospica robiniae]